jgi:HSP20 family molecular chaperone IbpA
VTFPLPTTMQVDFPSRDSNTSINYSRNSSRHSPSRFTQSNGHISTRNLDDYDKLVSNIVPVIHTQSSFDINPRYLSNDHRSSVIRSTSPIYRFRPSINDKTDYRRSDSPTLSNEDNFNFDRRSMTPSLSEHKSSLFPEDFDSDVFYQSSFQPQIFTDDRDQRYIEMKLDVHDHKPNEIDVSINDNDLIVQTKHKNFYKKITLPSNTDLTSLSTQHHHDKKLYITAKLLDEYSSLKYI